MDPPTMTFMNPSWPSWTQHDLQGPRKTFMENHDHNSLFLYTSKPSMTELDLHWTSLELMDHPRPSWTLQDPHGPPWPAWTLNDHYGPLIDPPFTNLNYLNGNKGDFALCVWRSEWRSDTHYSVSLEMLSHLKIVALCTGILSVTLLPGIGF